MYHITKRHLFGALGVIVTAAILTTTTINWGYPLWIAAVTLVILALFIPISVWYAVQLRIQAKSAQETHTTADTAPPTAQSASAPGDESDVINPAEQRANDIAP